MLFLKVLRPFFRITTNLADSVPSVTSFQYVYRDPTGLLPFPVEGLTGGEWVTLIDNSRRGLTLDVSDIIPFNVLSNVEITTNDFIEPFIICNLKLLEVLTRFRLAKSFSLIFNFLAD